MSKKQPSNLHDKKIDFISLGSLNDEFIIQSNSKYIKGNFEWKNLNNQTIYTLRAVSSTAKNLEKLLEEKGVENYTIKNLTFSTIIEEFENGNDIIAYITKEYVEKEISEGRLKIIKLALENNNQLELGIYYNTENKIKNIKRILKEIRYN